MQNRESDLDDFFAHESQSFPPSLSEFGKLYLPGNKSDLLQCIELENQEEPPTSFDCKIFDAAVIVHCLPTVNVNTLGMYADNVFIPYLEKQLQDTQRLDLVWDTYTPDSLKEATREKRGKGIRRKVSWKTKMPADWKDFLCDSVNKKELFQLLTSKVDSFDWEEGKEVYVTSGKSVLAHGVGTDMTDCNHEEADTRMIIHLLHALEDGAQNVQIRTVDTDVIVILIGGCYFFPRSHMYN